MLMRRITCLLFLLAFKATFVCCAVSLLCRFVFIYLFLYRCRFVFIYLVMPLVFLITHILLFSPEIFSAYTSLNTVPLCFL